MLLISKTRVDPSAVAHFSASGGWDLVFGYWGNKESGTAQDKRGGGETRERKDEYHVGDGKRRDGFVARGEFVGRNNNGKWMMNHDRDITTEISSVRTEHSRQ